MKAVRIHEFGGPEKLRVEDVPEPQPGAGEIRIRVIAAGVNPVDWKIREGKAGKISLPITMGVDVAGVVDAYGLSEEAFCIDDEVFAKTTTEHGAYAEFTIVHESQASIKPRCIDFAAAAAIPTAGLTAWQALFDIANLQSGQTVLIHGAAGGVGSCAVQFANAKGARVIGTAAGDHIEFVKSLGADEVIDYTTQRFENVAHNVDVVLDTQGGDTLERSWQVLKPGGFLVTTVGDIPEGKAESHKVRATRMLTRSDGKELAEIAHLIDAGKVCPAITTVLPLADAKKAQELSESHHARGKIVLRVAEEPGEMRKAA